MKRGITDPSEFEDLFGLVEDVYGVEYVGDLDANPTIAANGFALLAKKGGES